jgi:membrane protease YdiL (CAAX protease family)
MTQPTPRRWGLLDALLAVGVGLLGSVIVASILLGAEDTTATVGERFLVNLPLWAGLGLIPLWATSAKGAGPRVEIGLDASWVDLPIGIVVGTALQLVVIPLLYWPLSGVIDREEVEAPARELVDSVGGAGGWFVLVVTVAVMAPLVEEIFYRGMLQHGFARSMPMWTSVVLTAVIFGLMHFQLIQLLGLIAFGLAAGALVAWTGRLGTSMSTHIVFNLWAIWQASQL